MDDQIAIPPPVSSDHNATIHPGTGESAGNGTDNTLRGELAHFRYEAAAMRFMSSLAGAKRRVYQLVFAATVAAGVLTLLAAWTTS